MLTCVTSETVENRVHIAIDERPGHRGFVDIYCGHPQAEHFPKVGKVWIEDLWDMVRDNLAVMDVGPDRLSLLRRKLEALSAIKAGLEAALKCPTT